MNIQSRLEKLEKTVKVGGFCHCQNFIKNEIFIQDLTCNSTNLQPIRSGAKVPEHCPNCRRMVEKKVITICVIDRETKNQLSANDLR